MELEKINYIQTRAELRDTVYPTKRMRVSNARPHLYLLDAKLDSDPNEEI